MDIQPYFSRLVDYDQWANHEVCSCLTKLAGPPPRSVKFLSHIIAAEWLWLERIEPEKKQVVVWPELTLPECESQLSGLAERWKVYCGKLTEKELARSVSYVNSKGEPWSSTVEDILLHVVIHSAQHRGQIATELRSAGHEPPYTDYIHAVREGHIK
jgi:uncharacterized damage-inducible protein DinB